MAIKPIELLIRAKDEASGVLGSLQTRLMAMVAIITTYFGINAFIGAVKGAGDFEAALSKVQAATGGSKEELALLRKAAEESGVNSTQAAGALENLAKAGLSAKDAIGALPAVINLAKAGDIELGQASEVVTAAVMGMGLQFGETARVVDVMVMGANETKTSVKGMAEALSYAAPVANSMGLSLESTVAIIGQFAQAGIDASRAGTALNSILSQFNDPASKFRQELAAAGITTGNFEKALHQLAKAGPTGAKAIQAVGLEAGPALLAMLNRGMPALDALTAKLKSAEGAAAAAAKIMETNLNGALSGLESAWKYVKDTLTTPVLPVITSAVNDLTTALRGAVQDGTIGKFGEAIAAGFKTAIAWIKDFRAQIDFNQVSADLRAFADKTGAAFTQISEYASTAGNSAKLAYGVMSGGANAVLALVYALWGAFAEMAAKFSQSAVAVHEGLAKISLGPLRDRFNEAAENARNAAKTFGESAQAMRDKSNAAFVKMADGAQLARDSFTGLSTGAASAAPAVSAAAVVVDDLGAKLEATRQKSHDAEKATADKKATDEAAAVALRQLREEYRALMDKGDLQGATEKIKEINKALQATPPAAKDAAKATAETAKTISAAAAEQKQAADAASAAMNKLIKEYQALNSKGDLQGAAEKMQAINKAMLETPPAAKDAAKATADAATGQKQAAEAASAAVAKLRDEYKTLVANGDAQGAAEKIKEINKALQGTPPAAKDAAKAAEEAAKATAAAFAGLGITSQASLKMAADSARTFYNQIKGDAKSTSVDVANAFKAMAEKAIAANNGVATDTLKSEAAMHGLEIQTDKTGKSIVKSLGEGSDAAKGLGDAVRLTTEQIRAQEDAADRLVMKYKLNADYTARQIDLLVREAAAIQKVIDLENKRLNRDAEGFSIDPKTGQRIGQDIQSQRSVYENAKSQGLSEADALRISRQFVTDSGEQIGFSPGGRNGAMQGETWSSALQKAIDKLVLANAGAGKNGSSAQEPSTIPKPASNAPVSSYVTNITIDGRQRAVRVADAESATTLNDILRQLADARGTAS